MHAYGLVAIWIKIFIRTTRNTSFMLSHLIGCTYWIQSVNNYLESGSSESFGIWPTSLRLFGNKSALMLLCPNYWQVHLGSWTKNTLKKTSQLHFVWPRFPHKLNLLLKCTVMCNAMYGMGRALLATRGVIECTIAHSKE